MKRRVLSDACALQAAQMAGKWFIEKFLVHGLIAAISLPMTIFSVSSIIDAQWSVVRAYVYCRHLHEMYS